MTDTSTHYRAGCTLSSWSCRGLAMQLWAQSGQTFLRVLDSRGDDPLSPRRPRSWVDAAYPSPALPLTGNFTADALAAHDWLILHDREILDAEDDRELAELTR